METETKGIYEEKLQAQLDEWKAEIDKLKAKADKAEADARIEYYKQIDELRARHEEASEKLADLKAASSDAWEDIRSGVENARVQLDNAMRNAASRFQ
ncbi:MAG: coiled coil domain-containing protein [Desulfurivibrionaceae bacterium]